MPAEQPRHYSPIFREIWSINPKDFQKIIREYEYNEQAIGQLDPYEHFELTVLYVDALFATGAYRHHLLMVDLVISTSIDRNIQYLHGEDVYERMLSRKATSAFRTFDFATCDHICRELMRLYPENDLHSRLLRRAVFNQQRKRLQFGRGAAIFCFLLTALIIVLDLLFVKNFYPMAHQTFVWLRNGVFLAGIFLFVATYALTWYQAGVSVRKYSITKPTKNQLK